MEIITSAQNPKIKNLLLLQSKSRARREQGLFVVEGRRELEHCFEAGYSVRSLFICPEIFGDMASPSASLRDPVRANAPGDAISPGIQMFEIPEALYRKNLQRLCR